MENKSNYILVGMTVLALLLATVIFIVWMARIGGPEKKEYDIFFKQAVSGLARGSGVAFQGVPVGEVKRSEEHTSELQSLMRISYAVFCLKNKRRSIVITQPHQLNVQSNPAIT